MLLLEFILTSNLILFWMLIYFKFCLYLILFFDLILNYIFFNFLLFLF